MNAGMMWFDNDPKTGLTAKIERAVDYYRHKYGREPNLCLIHPSMLPPDDGRPATEEAGKTKEERAGSVRVRPFRPILPGHLWIGIEDKR
jgi:hypothetical protein